MTRVVYDGSQVRLEIEEVDGREVEIVRRADGVAIVAVQGDDVVLVRQHRHPTGGPVLELPAGKVDEGEEPLAAAKRELREECGLHGGGWKPLASFWTTPGFCDEKMHVFLAEGLQDGDPDPDEDEDVELVRWPVEEVARRVVELEDAKTLAGLLLFLREVSLRGS